jgi:hypothetical protein
MKKNSWRFEKILHFPFTIIFFFKKNNLKEFQHFQKRIICTQAIMTLRSFVGWHIIIIIIIIIWQRLYDINTL